MQTFKRRLVVLLAAVLLLSAMPVWASAEEAEFTVEAQQVHYSPLQRPEWQYIGVDLTDRLPSELENMRISDVLDEAQQDYATDATVAWGDGYSDDYRITDVNGNLSLFDKWAGYRSQNYTKYANMIVGDAYQLSRSTNAYYRINATCTPINRMLEFSLVSEADRTPITVYNFSNDYAETTSAVPMFWVPVDINTWIYGENAWLSMKLSDAFASRGLSATVYKGIFANESEAIAAGADCTDEVWAADLSTGGRLVSSVWGEMHEFTLFLKDNGVTVEAQSFYVAFAGAGTSYGYTRFVEQEEDRREWVGGRTGYDRVQSDDGSFYTEVRTYELPSGYSADDEYYFNLICYDDAVEEIVDNGIASVEKAVVGCYKTIEEASSAADIKAQLFSDAHADGGYRADFSDGVEFTIFDRYGEAYHLRVIAVEGKYTADSAIYFDAWGANKAANSEGYDRYKMPSDADSYYRNGYQTVMLLDSRNDEPYAIAEDTEIFPLFNATDGMIVYAAQDGESATRQESGRTAITFHSGKAVQYSVAAADGRRLQNYWVTYVTQQPGAKLYVNAANDTSRYDENGIPVREIFLISERAHDVFFANIGKEMMTGVYAILEDAELIELDDYWSVDKTLPDSARTLSAIAAGGYDVKNVGKIRIRSTVGENSSALIGGTLVISSDNGGEQRIRLTGIAGAPRITTNSVVTAVKYVPYSSVIQTNSMNAGDSIVFELEAGSLPAGMSLKPNGELYGVPTQAGSFTFTVKATYSGYDTDEDISDSREYTLTVLDSTAENVEAQTNAGYELLNRVTDMSSYADQVFRSAGEFDRFVDFWLDGVKLVNGQDYDAEEGSTKITVRAQTFRNAGTGTHTIAAEFRENGELKRTAQNYTVRTGGSSNSGTTTTTKPEKQILSASQAFTDIAEDAWYYNDVNWAYQNELMIGVAEKTFSPENYVTAYELLTVLARISKADLSAYSKTADGAWYEQVAAWAIDKKLVTANDLTEDFTRGQAALILVNYLRSRDYDCSVPADQEEFADARLMTSQENSSFHVLRNYGIFKGIGENCMAPRDLTTRAQMAALMHRISVFTEQR